ncbi:regulator of G-protein signaling 22-like [Carcharodon carcharias]|uniref:regulator of G-protein signaling 22-like n=1 Tax=Carcharodon carcharias TaxID=13397 RepID=UPI001B7EBAB2|nr:regulator of G-protein signaling 22-like [Carcharodon carcharias]
MQPGSGVDAEDSQGNSLLTGYHCAATSAGSAMLVGQQVPRDGDSKDLPLPVHSVNIVQIPEDGKGPNYWQKVPEEFCNYTLNSLIRNRLELDTFQIFLKENLAGMDLKCWLDIEYFRRIPHNEKDNRDVKSKEIKSKYLNRKYFFGPSSPATKAQQHEVIF